MSKVATPASEVWAKHRGNVAMTDGVTSNHSHCAVLVKGTAAVTN